MVSLLTEAWLLGDIIRRRDWLRLHDKAKGGIGTYEHATGGTGKDARAAACHPPNTSGVLMTFLWLRF